MSTPWRITKTVSTPWGQSQTSQQFGTGIVLYSTAGHGGFHVFPTLNKQIPDYMQQADGYANGRAGWYEEDCGWCIVVTVFPDHFDERWKEGARTTLRNSYPDAYERFYGVALQPGESHQRDRQRLEAEKAGTQ